MLKTLRIRDLAIIEDLSVEFGGGLNALTGETGAGKSIIVDALGLAAGDRADSTSIRHGADRAIVEAAFVVAEDSPLRDLAARKGVDLDDDTLVVRREVARSGGGRVLLNGSPSTVTVLRELGDGLVELHGQHEHQSLLSPARHRELLDEFGAHREASRRVEARHGAVLEARERLAEIRGRAGERDALLEDLTATLREIDSVAPRPGELDALDRERTILQNSGSMAELLEESVTLLYEGDTTAASLAAAAARRVESLAKLDPALEPVAQRVETARVELEDAGAALRDYRDGGDFDPARLEEVEARRAALERLLLRYGPDEAAALERREAAHAELEALGNLADLETAAVEAVEEAESAYVEAAARLGRARSKAAGRMKPRIEAQLEALALPRARFEIAFAPARGDRIERDGKPWPLGRRGAERAEFLLAANPGESTHALAKVASGGELARIMLSLHMVLEQAGRGRVLVFDEVDAGVSGAVADAVGGRLGELAAKHQVLCVTHLPQVAAHAERHYHVGKRVTGRRTTVDIASLSGEQRVGELARMLGGKEITPASTRNAAELLAAAEARRA